MSVYNLDIVRANGDMFAIVEIQNDYTGATHSTLRKIHLTDNEYWISVEEVHVPVTKNIQAFKMREDKINSALEYYNKYLKEYRL